MTTTPLPNLLDHWLASVALVHPQDLPRIVAWLLAGRELPIAGWTLKSTQEGPSANGLKTAVGA